MMEEKKIVVQSSEGIGLGGLVFILFLALKLLGKIDWSWWWVTSPLWLPITFVFGCIAVFFVVISLFGVIAKILDL